jgi:hypothetical protein
LKTQVVEAGEDLGADAYWRKLADYQVSNIDTERQYCCELLCAAHLRDPVG